MKENQKGFSESILILIVVVLIGVGGFWVYQNNQSNQQSFSRKTNFSLPSFQYPNNQEQNISNDDSTENKELDFASDWKTYTNTTYGYTFKYPPDYDDPNLYCGLADFDENLVRLFGCDSLVIQVEPVQTNETDPLTWWNSQEIESYSDKPVSCFSLEKIEKIESLYDENVEVIDFDREVLKLSNFESEATNCLEWPWVQILLIPHKGRILQVTYDWAILSERILSSFELID